MKIIKRSGTEVGFNIEKIIAAVRKANKEVAESERLTEQKIDEIHTEVVQNDNMLDALNLISIALGFYNSYLNIQQIDNNSIMAELNKQDKIYFERIIKLLEEIKGAKNDDE